MMILETVLQTEFKCNMAVSNVSHVPLRQSRERRALALLSPVSYAVPPRLENRAWHRTGNGGPSLPFGQQSHAWYTCRGLTNQLFYYSLSVVSLPVVVTGPRWLRLGGNSVVKNPLSRLAMHSSKNGKAIKPLNGCKQNLLVFSDPIPHTMRALSLVTTRLESPSPLSSQLSSINSLVPDPWPR